MGEWCFFIFNLVFILRWQNAPACTMQWFLPLTQVERAEWRHEAAVLLFIGTLTLFRPKTVSRLSSGPAFLKFGSLAFPSIFVSYLIWFQYFPLFHINQYYFSCQQQQKPTDKDGICWAHTSFWSTIWRALFLNEHLNHYKIHTQW